MKEYTKETKVSRAGYLPHWRMHGFVAAVHNSAKSSVKKQWITFVIGRDGTDNEEDFVYFSVTNLFDRTNREVEKGDHVVIEGDINSWPIKRPNGSDGWEVVLEASRILTWDEYQALKAEKQKKG